MARPRPATISGVAYWSGERDRSQGGRQVGLVGVVDEDPHRVEVEQRPLEDLLVGEPHRVEVLRDRGARVREERGPGVHERRRGQDDHDRPDRRARRRARAPDTSAMFARRTRTAIASSRLGRGAWAMTSVVIGEPRARGRTRSGHQESEVLAARGRRHDVLDHSVVEDGDAVPEGDDLVEFARDDHAPRRPRHGSRRSGGA